MATRAQISGSLTLSQPSGAVGPSAVVPFSASQTYSYDDAHSFSGVQSNAAVDLGPITSVKMLAGYADSPIDLKLTSVNGTDQVVPIQGAFLLHCDGRPITGIKLNGTASGKLHFAGD